MREVLPELLETEETAVRPRTIVRRAPRTARSGRPRHSRPERSRDRARLGSATRDETTRAARFPEHAPALPMKRGAGSAVHRKHVLTSSYPSSINRFVQFISSFATTDGGCARARRGGRGGRVRADAGARDGQRDPARDGTRAPPRDQRVRALRARLGVWRRARLVSARTHRAHRRQLHAERARAFAGATAKSASRHETHRHGDERGDSTHARACVPVRRGHERPRPEDGRARRPARRRVRGSAGAVFWSK